MEGMKNKKWRVIFSLLLSASLLTGTFLGGMTETRAVMKRPLSAEEKHDGRGQLSLPEEAQQPGSPQQQPTAAVSMSAPPATPSVRPTQSPAPEKKPDPERKPKPKKTPKPISRTGALKKVSHVKLVRYSTRAVKVIWKRNKKAKYYRVYFSKQKKGRYRMAGITKNSRFLVNKLKNKKTYFFYVRACKKKKASALDSEPSKPVKMRTKPYSRKTVFAGDSITEGIGYGYSFPRMHIGGRKKTVAYRGLNTITFHTKRVFNGRTGLQKLIAERPYRVYMMLGLNEIHYRPVKQVLAEYKDLIQAFRQSCPDTDIVLCALSPVTSAEKARCPGYWQIPVFNRRLKKMAGKMGFGYMDYTGFLKDSSGYLSTKYAAADGYHWQPSAYVEFAKVVEKFDLSLDRER